MRRPIRQSDSPTILSTIRTETATAIVWLTHNAGSGSESALRPERAGRSIARTAARRALSGYVFAAVGTATHYHADWVQIPGSSRSVFRDDGDHRSDVMAISIPTSSRSAFRDDRDQMGIVLAV